MENVPFASLERTALMRVRERIQPELLGRITEIIVFAPLDYTTQREICEGMIASEIARLAALGNVVEIGADAVEFLVRVGYHRLLGARPMRGAVERFLQDAIAENLLDGGTGCGKLSVEGERLTLDG